MGGWTPEWRMRFVPEPHPHLTSAAVAFLWLRKATAFTRLFQAKRAAITARRRNFSRSRKRTRCAWRETRLLQKKKVY
jgi:hypothetical protein